MGIKGFANANTLYRKQEISFTPGITANAPLVAGPSDETVENSFQTTLGLGTTGDKKYVLRADGAITPVDASYNERTSKIFYRDANGTPVWLQADYVQNVGASTNSSATVDDFMTAPKTEKGKIEYFTLNHSTAQINDLGITISKAEKSIQSEYDDNKEAVARELQELENQQLFANVNPIDFTTPLKIGGVQVGIIVDWKEKAASIGKHLTHYTLAQAKERESKLGDPANRGALATATAAKQKAEGGISALKAAGFSDNDPAMIPLKKQAAEAQKTLDSLATTSLDGSIRELESLKAECEKKPGRTPIILGRFGDDAKEAMKAQEQRGILQQAQNDFIVSISSQPGWFSYQQPVFETPSGNILTRGKQQQPKAVLDLNGQPLMETVYGRVPTGLDGDKSTAVK